MKPDLHHDLVSVLAGELDLPAFAARHGVTVEEATRLRAAFVGGMKASTRSAVRRSPRFRWVLAASALVATAAFAQLVVFQPDSPALATQVNGNFTQLRTWLENKVGPVGSATATLSDADVTGRVAFGSTTRQMLNLFASSHAIGVQNATTYFRSGGGFSFHQNGVHSNTANDPGAGGTELVRIDSAGRITSGGLWVPGADQRLQIIRGTVQGNASIVVGNGFTVTRAAAGVYDITFTRAFTDKPTVMCTGNHPTDAPNTAGVVQCLVNHPNRTLTNSVRILVSAGDNSMVDWPFSFVAMGGI